MIVSRLHSATLLRGLRSVAWHEWLLLAVLVALTDHYRWLMDDAFIYFRYADNLLFLQRGLVYNTGEYVEGYSSPLWMLLLLALRATSLDFYSIVRALAWLCAIGYGLTLIWLQRRLAPGLVRINFPLAASAAHYGITTHFSSGLETPLVQWLAPVYAAALLRPHNAWLQRVIALAPLVRPECAITWVAYLPWVIYKTRRLPYNFLGVALLTNASWLAFRVYYYADFLPNTFYLKDIARWDWGFQYWQNVVETHHLGWVAAALGGCAVLGRNALARTPIGPRVLMFAVAAAHATYVARVGGDMLYFRYAAFPVCLALCACGGVPEAALARLHGSTTLRLLEPSAAFAIALYFGLCYPPQLLAHPFHRDAGHTKWRFIADAQWHRRHSSLAYSPERTDQDARQRELYARVLARGEPQTPDILVNGFCRQGYRRFDQYVINSYGLTDPVLARLPRSFGRPGHKYVGAEAQQIRRLMQAARERGLAHWSLVPDAPTWVRDNREGLEALDHKIHSRRSLLESLRLALSPVRMR